MKQIQVAFIILWIILTQMPVISEDYDSLVIPPSKSVGLLDEDKDAKLINTPRYNFFGQSLCLFFPLIDESPKENGEIERNIYPIGIGGGVEYRTYILNRLFSSHSALPGIMLGMTFTFYMMEPQEKYQEDFGELTILTGGLYMGYQFIIPLSKKVSISPALFAGGRYYLSFHFFEQEITTAYNPIIISGIDLSIIFDRSFSISLRSEYQIYLEEKIRSILNICIGSGIFF